METGKTKVPIKRQFYNLIIGADIPKGSNKKMNVRGKSILTVCKNGHLNDDTSSISYLPGALPF